MPPIKPDLELPAGYLKPWVPGQPFRIPEDPHFRFCLNISGGRTSGYLLRRVLDAHGGELPENAIAVFANTGKEFPQTLDFVDRMEKEWGVKIHWLEYRHRPNKPRPRRYIHDYEEVTADTASRHGEPFSAAIKANKGFLPSMFRRYCTVRLKIQPIDRFCASHFHVSQKQVVRVLGIRADEPRRVNKALLRECRVYYPLAIAGCRRADVMDFWAAQTFNLQLKPHESNCDLCFQKTRAALIRIIQEHPGVATQWKRWEAENPDGYRFMIAGEKTRGGGGVTGLVSAAAHEPYQPDLFPDSDFRAIDCFCGDS